jgi:hypothetical protein
MVSINELMVRCFGRCVSLFLLLLPHYPTNYFRSLHTYKIPNKPIKEGYKIYGIADHGYVYNWIWSSREKKLQDIVLHPLLTPTSSLVRHLALSLPHRFLTIYIDNYFTLIALFSEL